MSYVYLIKNKEESYYKIGVGINPKKRIKQLQTGNSSPLELISTYETNIPYKIEKTFHNKYSHLKKEGEWFDLSIVEEISFLEDCKKIEENINFLINNGNSFI